MIYLYGYLDDEGEYTITKLLNENPDFHFYEGQKPHNDDILIRYGITKHPERDRRFVKVFNRAYAIINNTIKDFSLHLFKYNNIPIPEFHYDKVFRFKCLGRRIHHSKGKNITFINNQNDIENDNSNYYSRFINVDKEYRFHVFDNNVWMIAEKRGDAIIKNDENDIRFVTLSYFKHESELKDVAPIAIKSVKVLGLDFGSVDMVVEKETMKPYVLEVNTETRLNHVHRVKFADIIRGVIQ